MEPIDYLRECIKDFICDVEGDSASNTLPTLKIAGLNDVNFPTIKEGIIEFARETVTDPDLKPGMLYIFYSSLSTESINTFEGLVPISETFGLRLVTKSRIDGFIDAYDALKEMFMNDTRISEVDTPQLEEIDFSVERIINVEVQN